MMSTTLVMSSGCSSLQALTHLELHWKLNEICPVAQALQNPVTQGASRIARCVRAASGPVMDSPNLCNFLDWSQSCCSARPYQPTKSKFASLGQAHTWWTHGDCTEPRSISRGHRGFGGEAWPLQSLVRSIVQPDTLLDSRHAPDITPDLHPQPLSQNCARKTVAWQGEDYSPTWMLRQLHMDFYPASQDWLDCNTAWLLCSKNPES